MSEIRDLSSDERSVIEFLLQGDWSGAAELRSQLASAKHAGSMSDETASFTLAVGLDAPKAPAGMPGRRVGDLYLAVEDGVLVALECTKKTLPAVDELVEQ
jgi:hypothetical protein